eukprot:gene21762-28785_t
MGNELLLTQSAGDVHAGEMIEGFSDEAGILQIGSVKLSLTIPPKAFTSFVDSRKPGQACYLRNPDSKESSASFLYSDDEDAFFNTTCGDASQLAVVRFTNDPVIDNGPSDPDSLLPFNGSLRTALHHSCFHEVVFPDRAPVACAAAWLNSAMGHQMTWDAWAALETMKEVAVSVSRLHSHGITHGTIQADKVKLSHSNKDRRGFEASIELGWPAVVGGRGMKAPMSPCSPFAWESHQRVNNIIDRLALKESLSGYLPATADVLNIGIMLWETFVQEDIYSDVGLDMLQACLEKGAKPTMPLETPDRYRQLVEQCLDADPNARPTAEKLLLELTAIQRLLTGIHGPDSPCRILTWGLSAVTSADSQLRMEAKSEVQSEAEEEVDVDSVYEFRRMDGPFNLSDMGSSDEELFLPESYSSGDSPPVTIQSFLEPIPMNKSDILSAQLVPEIQSSPRSGSRSGFFSGDASRSLPKSESKPCSKKHLLESHDTVPPVKDFHMTDSMQEYVMEAYSALVTDSTEPVPVSHISHVLVAYGLL